MLTLPKAPYVVFCQVDKLGSLSETLLQFFLHFNPLIMACTCSGIEFMNRRVNPDFIVISIWEVIKLLFYFINNNLPIRHTIVQKVQERLKFSLQLYILCIGMTERFTQQFSGKIAIAILELRFMYVLLLCMYCNIYLIYDAIL